jgi:hypothetical protein
MSAERVYGLMKRFSLSSISCGSLRAGVYLRGGGDAMLDTILETAAARRAMDLVGTI